MLTCWLRHPSWFSSLPWSPLSSPNSGVASCTPLQKEAGTSSPLRANPPDTAHNLLWECRPMTGRVGLELWSVEWTAKEMTQSTGVTWYYSPERVRQTSVASQTVVFNSLTYMQISACISFISTGKWGKGALAACVLLQCLHCNWCRPLVIQIRESSLFRDHTYYLTFKVIWSSDYA